MWRCPLCGVALFSPAFRPTRHFLGHITFVCSNRVPSLKLLVATSHAETTANDQKDLGNFLKRFSRDLLTGEVAEIDEPLSGEKTTAMAGKRRRASKQ